MHLELDDELVEIAACAAQIGGDHAAGQQDEVTAEAKGDGTSVTAADKEVERRVREYLTDATEYSVWGEERNEEPESNSYWVVDPIDGTRNYADGLPLYATSVALVKDRSLEACGVSVPALDELWYAKRGAGAYCNDAAVHVSEGAAPEGYTSCASGYGAIEAHEVCIEVGPWTRRYTAAVYSLLTVAGGANEFCVVSALYPWDIAAGALLIREAGGALEQLGTADTSWPAIQYGGVLAWNNADDVKEAVYDVLTEERIEALSRLP